MSNRDEDKMVILHLGFPFIFSFLFSPNENPRAKDLEEGKNRMSNDSSIISSKAMAKVLLVRVANGLAQAG